MCLKRRKYNEKSYVHVLLSVIGILRKHDEESYLHSVRVADIAGRIAEGYGLDASAMPDLRVTGLLHDIGKLGVPSEILQKPGRLTDVEYMTVKRHTTLGYVILQKFDFPEHICEVALNHHERPDGTGYAKKTDLSVFSCIICAADCMDVMMPWQILRGSKKHQ